MMTNEERLGQLDAEQSETNRRLEDTNTRITKLNTLLSETNSRLER